MFDIKFVTAQPDIEYFHWQCEIYANSLINLGVDPKNIIMIFGVINPSKGESEGLKKLREKYNVFSFVDERRLRNYPPSMKTHLIYKFIKKTGITDFFLHDSDVVFTDIIDFDTMSDDVCYVSDTRGYLGFNYLFDTSVRYKETHKDLIDGDIVDKMSDIIGITPHEVRLNEDKTGGAQWYLKNQDWRVWKKIDDDAPKLYRFLQEYNNEYPIQHPIQSWTAEMWSILWNLWFYGYQTEISDELDFSWGTDNADVFCNKKIFHLAGVLEHEKDRLFFKGDFIGKNPIKLLLENENYFEYVDKNSATYCYVEEIKDFVGKMNGKIIIV